MNWFYELWLKHANDQLDNCLFYLKEWSKAIEEMNERKEARLFAKYFKGVNIIRKFSWLWFKYYWYRWIRRKTVIGFYDGIPIFEEVNND